MRWRFGDTPLGASNSVAGWSSLVARRAHNPKVVGSNPAPATIWRPFRQEGPLFFHGPRSGTTLTAGGDGGRSGSRPGQRRARRWRNAASS